MISVARIPVGSANDSRLVGSDGRNASFLNPVTNTTYRLRFRGDGAWRITKARLLGDVAILRHLHGTLSQNQIQMDDLHALVAGKVGAHAVSGDSSAAFPLLVLHDLDSTSRLLVAMASEARERCSLGAPGFRPGSSVLKQRARESFTVAEEGCRAMAAAWQASGLVGVEPEWMRAALAQ